MGHRAVVRPTHREGKRRDEWGTERLCVPLIARDRGAMNGYMARGMLAG
jgi:hypothetical protein